MKNRIRKRAVLALLHLFIMAVLLGCSPRMADAPVPTVAVTLTPVLSAAVATEPVTPTPTPIAGLPVGDATDAGFDTAALAAVSGMIQEEVEAGFPGAVLLVAREGHVVLHKAYGYARKWNEAEAMADPQPMAEDTLFDLASLTKFFTTSLAVMKLYNHGDISLDDPVSMYLDGFGEGARSLITLRMLLNHSAGFPATYSFYKPGDIDGMDTYSQDRARTVSLLPYVPLDYTPGTSHKYSDIGFMTLGAVIESITGRTLDAYVEQEIYKPLGLENIAFNPLDHGFSTDRIAATETMGNTRGGLVTFAGIRTETLHGQVHDENAWYSMGGVSGHAGLFADAPSLAVLCQMLLNGGSYGGVDIVSAQVVDTYLEVPRNTRYGQGFSSAKEYYGDYASESAICLTGWTGTTMVIDPERSLVIILLTNKRHSPCVGGEFQTAAFKTGRYEAVVAGIYGALDDTAD